MGRVRVLVGSPTHVGSVSQGTMLSIVSGASAMDAEVNVHASGFSLLASNFNRLFTFAYVGGYDYFILLHADIGVNPGEGQPGSWIDVLVQKAKNLDAAAVSATVPIKGQDGLTSLAINPDPANPYNIRRVTMTELSRLPMDFISRLDICDVMGLDPDVTGAMLINTGCLCLPLRNPKYDWRAARWPGFHIDDQLVWNAAGVPMSYVLPEDWCFSRWLFGKGWPYYATSDLHISHFGGGQYDNRGMWGHEVDSFGYMMPIEEYERSS